MGTLEQLGWVSIGVLLIMLVLLDLMATVLHPEAQSLLSSRFQRLAWRGLMLIERVVPERNGVRVVLNWALPLMVTSLITLWLVLLTTGFACLYYPWLSNPAFFTSTNPIEPTFLNALYYSGVTLATLGYGDVLPVDEPFRTVRSDRGTFRCHYHSICCSLCFSCISRRITHAHSRGGP